MQRNFFHIVDPPSPLVLAQPNYFFQIFGKCSKYFQLSKGKNHFFHKSPPLVVLSPGFGLIPTLSINTFMVAEVGVGVQFEVL